MSTIRVARRRRFTTVDRAAVNDASLSFRARGVLVWLLDKPDDWRCSAEDISAAGGEGRDAIRAALRELTAAGYLRREKVQGDDGRWATLTTVYEVPDLAVVESTGDGIPAVGSPAVGSPDVGAPGPLTNTETGTLEPKDPPPAAPTVGELAREIAQGYWDWVKERSGKAPAAVPFMGIVKVVEPFLVAGYAVVDVKLALVHMYEGGIFLSRQSVERQLDGRARWGARPGQPAPRLDDDRAAPGGQVAI